MRSDIRANPVMNRADRLNVVDITTPEGVPLRFEIARAGDRISAIFLDLVILMLLFLAVGLAAFVAFTSGSGWVGSLMMLTFFFLRNFYWSFFEIRWQGQTPGKRKMGIRVIDRLGGPLRTEAVLTRNFMREIELFLPLVLLMSAEALWPGFPGWARALAILWPIVFLCFPLFNSQRLRLGDLAGGTLVVRAPRAVLLPDLSGGRKVKAQPEAPVYTFSKEQLDVYGIYELQVLEDLLRKQRQRGSSEALQAVCESIKTKISWDPERRDVDTRRFLKDFYAAQRSALEHKMLFGERREHKRRKTRGGR